MRALLLALSLAVGGCVSTNPYYDPAKPHHRPDGFRNLDPQAVAPRPFGDFLRWRRERAARAIEPPRLDLSPVAPDLALLRADGNHFAVTWIGHATALVRIGAVNVLTDPHFSARASPVQWAGPKRHQPPGVALADLPRIDIVLISHNHYDHLDEASVRALAAQPGGPPLFVVPLGIERWLSEVGITNARALDWWEHTEAAGVTIHLTPAQHWSRRTLRDANTTLWGGFVIEGMAGGALRRVYFAGDTGYSEPLFRAIGARFAPIDLALLPIGGYEPRWFMRAQHVDPEEAVRIHRDVGARRSLGVHWGTFQLTDEPLDQAVHDLAVARQRLGLDPDAFVTLRHGQTLRLP
ncbi:MAG: MBL fold metallo-hydrolase [Sutterellaceae bacterium]|nr:MBL fold metallo-hydrolase [Burkholderiaceae bacterium]MDW8430372.1 MBL fold metallo-hydrolase [Sutterellaceae bacterium]